MPAVKPKRKAPGVDMTAMVDVAFLLLTFFILTTKFRDEETFPVDKASAMTAKPLPETGVVTIGVTKTGQVSMAITDFDIRVAMLEIIEAQYNYKFSDEGVTFFKNTSDFGLPFSQLQVWLNQEDPEMMDEFPQIGIPVPKNARAGENDLLKWIRTVKRGARRVGKTIKWAINGDKDAPYPEMDAVIRTMQDEDINRFYLVTTLDGADAIEPEEI